VELVCQTICNTGDLEHQLSILEEELGMLVDMVQSRINENAHTAQDQEKYQKRYNELVERYTNKKAEYDEVAKKDR